MSSISKLLTAFVVHKLESASGINAALAALRAVDSQSPLDVLLFSSRNVAPDLMEKSNQARYPAVLVYCEKLNNSLLEKFRVFSGIARLSIELRNSADRLEAMDSTLVYADVICRLLGNMRGEWTAGVSYNGGYDVVYSAIREGGKHFLQTAKITFEVIVSE